MTRVKICGVTRERDVESIVAAGADAIGVVCDVPVETPRDVTSSRAAALFDTVEPFVTTVLVTMPTDPEHAIELVERTQPDVLQVHATMTVEELESIQSATASSLLVAVDANDLEEMTQYDAVADGLLVDSVDADGAGGTGETHDWERTKSAIDDLQSPVILAGGLTPSNVTGAIQTVDPFAVDVSTGVEDCGGVKDDALIRSFVDRATSVTQTADRPT